ncbi:MAG: hypothetical protein PHZ26_00635 [Candidatus Gracilibacteria bacterium]|nr:hypothetical protein [Candidatus Gracilibacteria bacterium]MDD2908243.1 hypothetical protein [Candidatus Gracilibacteria bacterium]
MFESLILNGIGTFFGEKSAIEIKKIGNELKLIEKIHISNLFQIIISICILLITGNMRFNFDNTFLMIIIAMIIGSIGFNYFVMQAIEKADRSTNGLFSVLSIPLLLVSDLFLNYGITTYHIIGIIFIITTLVFISFRGSINLTGVKYTIATQIFAFINIMLFKIAITKYASVELLNILISSIMFIFSLSFILIKSNSINNIKKIYKVKYIKFGIFGGLGGAFNSMGYVFGPASIITALKRILSMFWGVVMGKIYFHEEKFYQKLSSVAIIGLGVVIMNLPVLISNKVMLASVNSALLIKGDIKGYKQVLKTQNIDLNKNLKESIARPEFLYNLN